MWLYIAGSVIWAIIVVMSVIQLVKRADLTDWQKRLWIVLILIAPVVGLIIYYFAATPKKLV